MVAHVPGRPVLSEACQRRVKEIVDAWPLLSEHQRAVIGTVIRSGRRLGQVPVQGSDAA